MTTLTEITEKDVDRFWSKVDKLHDPDGCWLWQASRQGMGHGLFRVNKRLTKAHRFSALLAGAIENLYQDINVLHSCDTPPCVNPKHLFTGTRADNNFDRDLKGRHVPLKGEDHGMAVMSWTTVNALRKEFKHGSVTQKALALKYGIAPCTVNAIIKNRLWK